MQVRYINLVKFLTDNAQNGTVRVALGPNEGRNRHIFEHNLPMRTVPLLASRRMR